MSRKLEIAAFVFALVAAAIFIRAWLSSHDDLVRLQSTLAAQKQTMDAADARERERAVTLKDTLAQIDALKKSAQSPAQILPELSKYLSLPQPITLVPQTQPPSRAGSTVPNAVPSVTPAHTSDYQQLFATNNPPKGEKGREGTEANVEPGDRPDISGTPPIPELPNAPEARIPVADLKPLYDYVQDCRACQAQLAAARLDAADDAAKMNALTQERDAAIKALKGGSIGRRIRRNMVWFFAGAAAGAIAACGSGHCRR
jgi:hypothetical protein